MGLSMGSDPVLGFESRNEHAGVLAKPKTGSAPLKGVLVLDDSTLDKLYARQIDLVTRHRSNKRQAVFSGINLITLLCTDGDRKIPCDYRIFDNGIDGVTKNDHFFEMLLMANT
jgi:putative transposase